MKARRGWRAVETAPTGCATKSACADSVTPDGWAYGMRWRLGANGCRIIPPPSLARYASFPFCFVRFTTALLGSRLSAVSPAREGGLCGVARRRGFNRPSPRRPPSSSSHVILMINAARL